MNLWRCGGEQRLPARLSQKNRVGAGPRPRLGTGDGEDADALQAGLGIFLG